MKNNTLLYQIQLNTTDNAVRFVNTINSLDGNFDLHMGSYCFDAKSMLGVLSIDPRRIMLLHVVSNIDNVDTVNAALEPFCV